MVDSTRIKVLNTQGQQKGQYVLYWMQSAQRTIHNHALYHAIEIANQKCLPLRVVFVVVKNFPNANTRHYEFMIEGLIETERALKAIGCDFYYEVGDLEEMVLKHASDAEMCIMDDAYLIYERQVKSRISEQLNCSCHQVFTNLLIPVDRAYPKSAYGAYVIRPSIHKLFDHYYRVFDLPELEHKSVYERPAISLDLLEALTCDKLFKARGSVGGFSRAIERRDDFIKNALESYGEEGNDPSKDLVSGLSPYLHFGQISPITILEGVYASGYPAEDFVEQLIVRRELAFNYVHYEKNYQGPLGKLLPEWALKTLEDHSGDMRDPLYDLYTLEHARTYDEYWNAAQNQLRLEGRIHNYMRMYWGKKVIEWSRSPQEAFDILCYLNDKFALDGRDPNGYAGIAWCFGKHDRPWGERMIFGKVRFMNAKGLKRKFKLDSYLEKYREVSE